MDAAALDVAATAAYGRSSQSEFNDVRDGQSRPSGFGVTLRTSNHLTGAEIVGSRPAAIETRAAACHMIGPGCRVGLGGSEPPNAGKSMPKNAMAAQNHLGPACGVVRWGGRDAPDEA